MCKGKLTHNFNGSDRLTKSIDTQKALTTHNVSYFTIYIRDRLQNNYEFKDMKESHIKPFHQLIDRMIGKTWNEVDRDYKRGTDKNDKCKHCGEDHDIIHYGIKGNPLRLHGYLFNGSFVLLRIDCNHKVHKGK